MPKPQPLTPPAGPDDEPDRSRVVQWRIERLLDAGYNREAAVLIGHDTSIDLHVAVELLRRGCPAAAALQILF
jgi:hypothetical protein